jgi:hypothetical protein
MGAGGMVQVVKCLPSKHCPVLPKKNKKRKLGRTEKESLQTSMSLGILRRLWEKEDTLEWRQDWEVLIYT